MFDIVLSIGIILSNILMLWSYPQNLLDIFLFPFISFTIIGLGLCSEKYRDFNFKYVILIPVILSFIQFFFYFTPETTAYIYEYFIHYSILVMLIYTISTRTKNFKLILIALSISLFIQLCFFAIQVFAYTHGNSYLIDILSKVIMPGYMEDGKTIHILNLGGLMGNVTRLTFLICILLPVLLQQRLILYSIVSISLGIFFVTFYSDPQAEILVLSIINILIVSLKNFNIKKYLIIFLLLIISCIGIYKYDSYNGFEFLKGIKGSCNVRYELWKEKYNEIKDFRKEVSIEENHKYLKYSIFLGRGMGVQNNGLNRKWKDSTLINSYFYFIVGFGILGLCFIVAILYLWFRNFKFSFIDIVLINISILSFIEYIFEIKRFWIILASIISLKIIESIKEHKFYELESGTAPKQIL